MAHPGILHVSMSPVGRVLRELVELDGLLCVAVRCSVMQRDAMRCRLMQCVAVCCSVLPCVAVCCSVLQCVAARPHRA